MSHEISNIDRQEGTEIAWHRLTVVRPTIPLDDCFLSKWDVVPTPLQLADGTPVRFNVFRCSETGEIIGRPFDPDTYSPISNARFLTLIREALTGTSHKIVSVGSVCRRGRIFVSVKLDALPAFSAAGRKFEQYLNFLTSHDFSTQLITQTSNVCVVCNNTFRANLQQAQAGTVSGFRSGVLHRGNVEPKLAELSKAVDAAVGVQAEFQRALNDFDGTHVTASDAKRLFTGFVARNSTAKSLTARAVKRADRLVELFQHGRGNSGRTLADAFSAVTDYFTHENAGGSERPQRQFESSEFASGNSAKSEFFQILRSAAEFEKTVKAGAALLA